ncbi:regenerating islet-derived protein 4 [Lemur catta]|uniref:regenerating islet-derived protein 4 n=1 Tax=Lemur catta TaxID=9447 RepID=UPI001E269EDB|nr:regenerating islet-derived protein 4 [Lemur catta]
MASKVTRLLLLLSFVANPEVLGDIIMRPSFANGWFHYRSNCYEYFRKLRNWSDAELECQSYENGALMKMASILNLKEASVIAEYISGYQRNQPVWIGLHDLQKRQQWQWMDGASHLHRPWSGQAASESKHCAELSSGTNFLTWNNNDCSKRQHFLCKYRP